MKKILGLIVVAMVFGGCGTEDKGCCYGGSIDGSIDLSQKDDIVKTKNLDVRDIVLISKNINDYNTTVGKCYIKIKSLVKDNNITITKNNILVDDYQEHCTSFKIYKTSDLNNSIINVNNDQLVIKYLDGNFTII